MKTLLVMRHAKSDYPANLSSDFDRPLNKRGNNDLPRIAQLLGGFGPLPDAVIASPALRARQTAEGLVRVLNLSASSLKFDESLYLASPKTLTQSAVHWPNGAQTVLIIAHNPGLEEWVSQLAGAQILLPTAGLVAIDLELQGWKEIDRTPGRMRYFVIPRLIKSLAQ